MIKHALDYDQDKLAQIRQMRADGKTWREIAPEGVSPATIWKWDKMGVAPQKRAIRDALGLPSYAPGRVCPEHGVVHDHVHHVKPAWLAEAVANLRALEKAARKHD